MLKLISILLLAQFTVPMHTGALASAPSASPTYYAIARGQETTGGLYTANLTYSCAVGHSALIVVWMPTASETFSLSTSTGNTLNAVVANQHAGATITAAAWTINNCNGTSGTYTYSSVSHSYFSIEFVDITGANTSGIYDTSNFCSNTSTSSSPSCAVTTTAANDLIFTLAIGDNSSGPGAAAGWTQLSTQSYFADYYLSGASIGANTFPSVGMGATDNNAVLVVAIK